MIKFLDEQRPEILLDAIEHNYSTVSNPAFIQKEFINIGNSTQICTDKTLFIDQSLEQKIESIIKVNGSVRLLDIGCGAAKHLVHLKKRYKNDFHALGVTAPLPGSLFKDVSTIDGKVLSQLDIRTDNAEYLERILRHEEPFDISISRWGLNWFVDPVSALQRIIQKTKIGGDVSIMPLFFEGMCPSIESVNFIRKIGGYRLYRFHTAYFCTNIDPLQLERATLDIHYNEPYVAKGLINALASPELYSLKR